MEKRGIRLTIGAFLLPLLLTACQPREITTEATKSRALVEISQDIDASAPVSKAVVTGSNLAVEGSSYGLIVCKHEDSPLRCETYDGEGANLYANIQAWYGNYNSKGTKWWYSYESSNNARFEPLYLLTEDTTQHLDIYAYSPWKKGVTLQDGYTYNLNSVAESSLPDVMYATYEGGDGHTPTNTDHSIGRPSIPVSLHFHHKLARIAFHLKLATAQNTGLDGNHAIRLYTIKLLRNTGSATPLYTEGTMSLLTGTLTPTPVVKNEQSVTYATSQSTTDGIGGYDLYQDNSWKTFNMLLHPIPYQNDGDFTFQFWFNGTDNGQTLIQTYDIKRSDLLHGDDSTYGFQGGCSYDFYFVIDNYIHLQNVTIREWTDENEEEIKV